MDIYQFAMNMEKDGEHYYRSLAKKTDHEGLKRILTLLADEEVKHYRIIEQLKRNAKHIPMKENTLFDDVKNIFAKLKKNEKIVEREVTEVALYQKARRIEQESHAFYLEKANEVKDEREKTVLLHLAEEEKKHMFLVDTLIEFLTRPQTWLENAEWYHLDEY